MRKWPTQVSTVVANVGRELSLLKMAINMANADYPSFFLWNELEPRCQQRAAGSLELVQAITHHPPVQGRSNTKFGPEVQNTLAQIPIVSGVIDLDPQGEIQLKNPNLLHSDIVRIITGHPFNLGSPNLDQRCNRL